MKSLKPLIATFLIAFAAVGSNFTSHAQLETEANSVSLIDELPQPQLMDAGAAPLYGTYFMLSDFQRDWSAPPYPMNPFYGAKIYSTGAEDIYIVDDSEARPEAFEAVSNVDLATLEIWERVQAMVEKIQSIREQRSLSASFSLMTASSIPSPEDGEGSTNGWYSEVSYSAPVYGSNDLWLEITGVSNSLNQVYLTVHGTVADTFYEILSREHLEDTTNGWHSEGKILGLNGSTPTTLLIGKRTNNLFFWCRSWQDTDLGGLPDWWQLQWFAHLGVDPYGDDDDDGWNNLQEYQNGTNPLHFDTPPPPFNLAAKVDAEGTGLILTWEPSAGPVSEYVIKSYWNGEIDRVGPQVTSYAVNYTYFFQNTPDSLWVEAVFTNGAVAGSEENFTVEGAGLWKKLNMVRGPEGLFYLALSGPAPNLAAVRINVYGFLIDSPIANLDIPLTSFTNGIAAMPKAFTEEFLYNGSFFARGIATDGSTNGLSEYVFSDGWFWGNHGPIHEEFLDLSSYLKKNLEFQARAATISEGFSFYGHVTNDYIFAAYYDPPTENFYPVTQNYYLRNFNFNSLDGVTNWNTGAGYDRINEYHYLWGLKYYFYDYTNPPPRVFSWDASSQFYHRDLTIPFDDPDGFGEIGLVTYANGRVGMGTGLHNFYGLPINSVLILNRSNSWSVSPNQIVGPLPTNQASYFFFNTTPPTFETIGSYFTKLNYLYFSGPVPGDETFTPSVSSPFLVLGCGQPSQMSAWEKQRFVNGYSGKWAFLQQYFDKAFKVNSNGSIGAQTGVLSPYGDFMPTEPGLTAIVTQPDNGMRTTGLVHVIKIQLDVNHDGIMDTSFGGPDNTSPNHPLKFWINNDFDRGHRVDCGLSGDCDFEEDDLSDHEIFELPGWQQYPDCEYRTNMMPAIPSSRDLEDYARLWIPGLNSLLADLPPGYTVQLSAGYNPIRVFKAVEADGGTNYLFDEATASNQVAQSTSLYLGEIGDGNSITLSGLTNVGEHFIFCGVRSGWTEVHLHVFDTETNAIAETGAYLTMYDIKNLMERWTVGERPKYAPTNVAQRVAQDLPDEPWQSKIPHQFGQNTDTNTPYILYVHGWNMHTWEKDSYAETAYKRLYWQGYQGKFGVFHWPTDYGFGSPFDSLDNPITDSDNYDRSEHNAWRSGVGLLNLLTNLNSDYPGHVYVVAHSMGNVVAGEAFRLAGTNQVANTYIASQAAVPGHCYDSSLPDYSFTYTINFGPFTPNIYKDWLLSNNGGVGRRINFYNTNDYALNRPLWELNQLMKPDTGITDWTYNFDGYPYDGVKSYTPGAPDDTPPWNHFFKESALGTQVYFDIVNVLTNRYEVMAMAAQARSTALGRTANVQNLNGNVELTRVQNPRIWPSDLSGHVYGDHKWHSAQFRSTNMRQSGYWRALLSEQDGFDLATP